jgi:acetyl-CoA acyltransferase
VFVVGNGMTRFHRPGKHAYDYPDLANIAMKRALDDSKVSFKDHIEAVYVGYVYGDSCSGQKAVYTID